MSLQLSPSVSATRAPVFLLGSSTSRRGLFCGSLMVSTGSTASITRTNAVRSSYKTTRSPICVLWDIERFTEMVHFNIINTRQRKMSTDIVDRHLVQIQNVEGIKMVASGARGERDFLRATATKVVDRLNDAPGVWQHQISVPGVPGRESGLVRQHAMVVSIEPLLKDAWVRGASDDDRLQVLVNFWDAVQGVWSDAFDSPKEHRIQATVGVYSLHMVLPVIIQRCLEDRDLSRERMQTLIEGMNLEEDFWHKEEGHPLTLGTGMASIRALAQYLTERLPQRSQANVKI